MGLFRAGMDETLLSLVEESGRNAERSTVLLRELLADFPERSGLSSESIGSRTRATASPATAWRRSSPAASTPWS